MHAKRARLAACGSDRGKVCVNGALDGVRVLYSKGTYDTVWEAIS